MHVLARVFSCLVRKSLYTLYNIINDIILVQLDFATIFTKKKTGISFIFKGYFLAVSLHYVNVETIKISLTF